VSSTPVAVNNATADVGIFLMIGALRQAQVPLSSIRAGMTPEDMRQETN
jgi:D-3-phosphoglycerate dehydrogenase